MADPSRYHNSDGDPAGPWFASDLTAPGTKPHFAFEIGNRLPPVGRHWRFNQNEISELQIKGRILFPSKGLPRFKRYLSEQVYDMDVVGPDPEQPELNRPTVLLILSEAMRGLARAIARSSDALESVEWRDMERILFEVFEGLGFATHLTRPAKDGGFDMELHREGRRFLVEVKHWSATNKVGAKIVTGFAEVVIREGVERGLLLAKSGFTNDVMEGRVEMERHRLGLGDRLAIVSLCRLYAAQVGGLLKPLADLPEIIFENTFDPACKGAAVYPIGSPNRRTP